MRKDFGGEVAVSESVADAVQGASVITTITRAKEPFLRSDMIERGTHINAVGAIFTSDPQKWTSVRSLGELVVAKQTPRKEDDVTLLKSLGTGVLDLSIGIEIFERIEPRSGDRV